MRTSWECLIDKKIVNSVPFVNSIIVSNPMFLTAVRHEVNKFQVNLPFGSGEEAKIDFQDGRYLGFPIGKILVIFNLQVTPMHPTKSFESIGLGV